MYTPTAFQGQLLRAVQNLAFDTAEKRSQTRRTPMLAAQIATGDAAGEQIEAVAVAIGIPRAWIDYARVAGGQGQRWHPQQQMLTGKHPARGELLTAHTARIRDLQEMTAAAVAYPRRVGAHPETVAKVRQVIGITWQRVGAIGHVLALTREERQQCWQPGPQQWTSAVAAKLDALDDTSLAQRWQDIHTRDFTPLAMPIMVMQAAGITHDDIARQLPLSPDQMVDHVGIALPSAPSPTTVDPTIKTAVHDGARISAAIDSAGLTTSSKPLAATEPAPITAADSAAVDLGAEP